MGNADTLGHFGTGVFEIRDLHTELVSPHDIAAPDPAASAAGARRQTRLRRVPPSPRRGEALEGKPILRGVSLVVRPGERHAIMGPNGSGKTTLAMTIMGHPRYRVSGGDILIDGESILGLATDERARKGLFLAFQYPMEIPGVTNASFLRQAVNAVRPEPTSVFKLQKEVKEAMAALEMDEAFARRYLNQGFSGGEKKRNEVLQLALLKPRLAILDETDSGLDIDAVKIVSRGVLELGRKDMGTLIITHYTRILRYLPPDFVHVLVDGRIVRSGGPELADELEERGYDPFKAAEVAG